MVVKENGLSGSDGRVDGMVVLERFGWRSKDEEK